MWYCSDSTDSLPRSRARNFTSHQPSWYQSSQPSPRTSFFSHPGGDAGGVGRSRAFAALSSPVCSPQ